MNKLNIKKISDQITQLGVFHQENIFEDKEFEFVSSKLNNLTKKEKKIYFPTCLRDYLIKILKFDLKKIFLSKRLIKIANDLDFSKIASDILGNEVFLETLDCYLSKKSNNTILEWHNDIGYTSSTSTRDFLDKAKSTVFNIKTSKSSVGIKFFIYITDVKKNDGALGIVPYSHKIVNALTKSILEKKINLSPYWKLKDLRNLLLNNNNKKHLLNYITSSELENFLERTKFIESATGESFDYDFEMRRNSVVIFDELAIHRGSAPTHNNRLVLRYLYRAKL